MPSDRGIVYWTDERGRQYAWIFPDGPSFVPWNPATIQVKDDDDDGHLKTLTGHSRRVGHVFEFESDDGPSFKMGCGPEANRAD